MWFMRDASFSANPDTRSGKKYHLEESIGSASPLCGAVIMLCEDGREDPPDALKCKKCLAKQATTKGGATC